MMWIQPRSIRESYRCAPVYPKAQGWLGLEVPLRLSGPSAPRTEALGIPMEETPQCVDIIFYPNFYCLTLPRV